MVFRPVRDDKVLNDREAALLDICLRTIASSLPLPKTDDIAEVIGVSNGGTVSDMFRRLHDMGKIELRQYQKGRQVCIGGKCSALPLNAAPHWRHRPRDIPSPAPREIQQRSQPTSALIIQRAGELGKPVVEYLADLVFIGWEVEKERG